MTAHPCGNDPLPVRVWPPRPILILLSGIFSMNETQPSDRFDPESLRLPPGMVGDLTRKLRPPRHRRGEAFLMGPIPWAWWASACRLPGAALQVASVVRFRAGWKGPNAITLGLAEMSEGLGVEPRSARRALVQLELAGLVTALREPGCKPVVSILTVPAGAEGRKPLYGPIPWNWWSGACRLPGKSLQVASALWFLAGWSRGREAVFEFGLSEWEKLGLDRFSAGRGLGELEAAGLVSVERRDGRKPVVTVTHAREAEARRNPSS